MTKQEAQGAYKALKKIVKEWDRYEFENMDFIPLERIEEELTRYMKLIELLDD